MNSLNVSNAKRHITFLQGQGRILLGLSLLVSNLAFTSIAHAAIIGVDLEAGNGVPTNWNSYTFTDGRTITSLTEEDGSSTGVEFQLAGVTNSLLGSAPPPSGDIPTHSNDLTNLCCDYFYNLTGSTITATWSELIPSATYNYWFITSGSAEQPITVTGSTVAPPFSSPEITSSTSAQAINDEFGSSGRTFASYAHQIQASGAGTITIEIDANYPAASGFALELVTVPIPAAVWLFGSGLIGLIGIARRKRAV